MNDGGMSSPLDHVSFHGAKYLLNNADDGKGNFCCDVIEIWLCRGTVLKRSAFTTQGS